MKLTLDTNVLVAAFATQGVCAELLDHCQRGHEIVLSKYILDELRAMLEEKIGLARKEASDVVDLVRGCASLVIPADVQADACRDPSDLPVLRTVFAGQSRALITGDKDLIVLGEYQGIRILRPSGFWKFEAEEAGNPRTRRLDRVGPREIPGAKRTRIGITASALRRATCRRSFAMAR